METQGVQFKKSYIKYLNKTGEMFQWIIEIEDPVK